MSSPRRALALAVVSFAVLVLPAPSAPAQEDATISCLTFVEDVGMACPREGGLFEVYAPDGSSLGFTHGGDASLPLTGSVPLDRSGERSDGDDAPAADVPAGEAGLDYVPTAPRCVEGRPGQFYALVIYARAADDADRYATVAPQIRSVVRAANGWMEEAALATGAPSADFRVHCTSGQITVVNAVLPTSVTRSNFGTIVGDLWRQGFTDKNVKHWIFFDDTRACGCAGQGNVAWDDRPLRENQNNGNLFPMYAISYGYMSAYVMLHELGHNLGAVQLSAPHTSGAWHCNDGYDVMCYRDGGPKSSAYTTTACAAQVWDCRKDDYFNANPPNGSYLATHWNIGARHVRFVDWGDTAPPVARILRPSPGGVSSGCVHSLALPGPAAKQGRGEPFVPPPEVPVWPFPLATPTAPELPTEVAPPPFAAPALPPEAPALPVETPALDSNALPAIAAKKLCVLVEAVDVDSEVAGVVVSLDGLTKATITRPNAGATGYRVEIPVPKPMGLVTIGIEAYDLNGNSVSAERLVVAI